MEGISLLISVILTVFLFVKLLKKNKVAEILDKIPGPPTLPIVGNLFDIAVRREKVMKGMMCRKETYGSIFRTWLGPIPIVHVSHPEYVEVILSSSKHTRKGNFYRFLYPWLGTGLLTSSGRKWFNHRKLITPTFHFKILDTFIEVFSENAEILVKRLEDKGETNEPFDVYPFITLCALDIICETAMGVKIFAQSHKHSSYVTSVYKISELTVERSNKLWLHPEIVYYNLKRGRDYRKHLNVLHGFTEGVIKNRKGLRQRQKELKMNNEKETENDIGTKKRQAFLDLLLEASENDKSSQLSDVDIREEVDTFMFEGHDTTTAGICWTLHSLGLNPKIQDDLAEEMKGIFGEDRITPPTMRDLGEMKLLERVIKESLRLYPSVAFISRRLDEDVQLGKYTVPAETTVAIDIINMHRSSEVFPDPEKFDPDRWLPENNLKRHPYAYIPFSAGPRNCIGQKFALLEEKVVLSTILRNYEVETVTNPMGLTLTNELILRPIEGIQLKIKPRS